MNKGTTFLLISLFVGSPVQAEDWPGWRGPRADGTSKDQGFPVEWDSETNIRWKVPLPGAGNSSPVIVEGRVYLTATTGRDHSSLHVLCLNMADGQRVWETRLFGSPSEAPFTMFPPERGHAASTVAVTRERVIALFGTGDLVCLDTEGKPCWMRSLATEFGTFRNDYGIASSPIMVGELVVVQIDHLNGSYLLAVDRATGRTQWKTDRPDVYDNWSTPVVADVRDKKQLICLGSRRVAGYDLDTGKQSWSLEGLERLCATTAIVRGDRAYVVSGPSGATLALDLSATPVPKVLWKSRKNGPFVPSPVVSHGFYLMTNDQGMAFCLDLETGKEHWRERLGGGGRMRPSPVAADGLIYFTSLDGVTTVVRASEEFQRVGENPLGEAVAASLALSDGSILIRTERHLYCIANRPPSQ